MSKVIKRIQCGKYTVYELAWEPTPKWLVRWFGFKPYRQHHCVPMTGEPLDYWTYADAIPEAVSS